MLHDFSLCQLVQDPARGSNVLDLVLTQKIHLQCCIFRYVTTYQALIMMLLILNFPPHLLSSILLTVTCTITKKLILTSFEKPYHLFHGKLLSLMILILGGRTIINFFAAVSTDVPVVHWCLHTMPNITHYVSKTYLEKRVNIINGY